MFCVCTVIRPHQCKAVCMHRVSFVISVYWQWLSFVICDAMLCVCIVLRPDHSKLFACTEWVLFRAVDCQIACLRACINIRCDPLFVRHFDAWMYVCMYVCMYTLGWMYVCLYVCMYVYGAWIRCLRAWKRASLHTRTHVRTHKYTHSGTHAHLCASAVVIVCVWACVHVCMSAQTYT
jgi:hypothetical protein